MKIADIIEDARLIEIGRQAIEDALIEMRDSRMSVLNRGNGLVVYEKDGTESSIIRFGPEMALRIGLKAINKALLEEKKNERG